LGGIQADCLSDSELMIIGSGQLKVLIVSLESLQTSQWMIFYQRLYTQKIFESW